MSDKAVINPEVRWTWRRVYSYGQSVIYSLLLAAIIVKLPTAAASAGSPLMWIGLAIVGAQVIVGLLYLAGATATDIARVTAAARAGAAPPEGGS
ncbi:hypothetical protein OVA11_14160 [Caulobacter sp. SL161]|uniref:hypothetical protein n=1 Tax=Caulobacter sp. SL161 TaxID=2995156 RepID=UPI002275C809|nr:hypothetical protein [Caulobacter sp. SL161]MCY1648164.1 hypothetical protein [Caulobacter sp. SL161]